MKSKRLLMALFFVCMASLGLIGCQKELVVTTSASQENAALLSNVTSMTSGYLSTVDATTSKNGRWKRIIGADLEGALGTFLTFWFATTGNEYQLEITSIASSAGAAAASIAASLEGADGGQGRNPNHVPIENPGNSFDDHGRMHYEIVNDVFVHHNTYIDANNHLLYAPTLDHAYSLLEQEGLLRPGGRDFVPVSTLEANHPNYLTTQNIIAFMNGINDPNFLPGEQAILAQYFAALMGSTDADAFAAYSVNVENQIAASTLSPKSKAILLIEMATARYGIAYWM